MNRRRWGIAVVCSLVVGCGGDSAPSVDGGGTTADGPAAIDGTAAMMDVATAADSAVAADAITSSCDGLLYVVGNDVGGTDLVFKRAKDGAILLAHYAPGTYHDAYDTTTRQLFDSSGGATPPFDWAPRPCDEDDSGHVAFTNFAPNGTAVMMECGENLFVPSYAAVSDDIFRTSTGGFAAGTKVGNGVAGVGGAPGWGAIAPAGSGDGLIHTGMCGTTSGDENGGISYCSGAGGADTAANHLVSYTMPPGDAVPLVACDGVLCPDCHVWIWLLVD